MNLVAENVQNFIKLSQNLTFENFFQIICQHGNRIAAEYMEDGKIKYMTYDAFGLLSRRIAYRLGELLGNEYRGRYVGIHLDNCPEWNSIFWGILMAGYHPILLDFRATRETLLHLLKESDALAIITHEKETIREGLSQYSKSDIISPEERVPDDWKPSWGKYLALCTSGTTSTSKIFVYDDVAITTNLGFSWKTYLETPYLMHPKAKVLAFIPMYHIFGLFTIGFWPSLCGVTVVYLKDRSPITFLETCRNQALTHVYGVPILWNNAVGKVISQIEQSPWYRRLLFHSMANISLALQRIAPVQGSRFAYRYLFRKLHEKFLGTHLIGTVSGGAYLSPKTLRFLHSTGIIVLSGFGMTEGGILCTETGTSYQRRINSCVGKPFPPFEIKIVPLEEGERNGNGIGQLFIRGRSVHTGRLEGGQMVPPNLDAEGWFNTGDLAIYQEDHLYLKGRSKDTIIKETGEKVYPDELEDRFRGIEGMEEYCVVGLRNSEHGEETTLVFHPGKQAPLPMEQVASKIYEVNSRLPIFKRLNKVLVSECSLPVTTSMKIQRQRLKKLLEENTWKYTVLEFKKGFSANETRGGQQAQEEKRQEIKEGVRKIFAEILGKSASEIRDDAHFIEELGGDSLMAIALASELEKKYKVFIPDSVLLECTNVQDISGAIIRLLHENGHDLDYIKAPHPKNKRKTISKFEESREYKIFSEYAARVGSFNPYFVKHDSVVKDTSLVEGKAMINLASYNYLGLSGHPRTVKAAQEAAEKYGTSASGSRLLTGEKSLYRELEKELAKWKNVEDSIVLVSGHATNVTFVGNFCNENDLVVYDALSHNSIEQGCRLSRSDSKAFPHNDFGALENILRQTREYYEKILIVVEGVYSMDGDIAPIPRFIQLKNQYGAFLMVDEAHSTCVLGKTGKGVDEHFSLAPEDIDIRMGTLSKGLGSCGGYIAGEKSLIEYLRYNLPGFVFSVGISPSNAAAALEAIHIVKEDHSMVQSLHENISFFLKSAHERDFNTCLAGNTAIIPILIGDESSAFVLSKKLKEKGICVPPAVYPAVPKGGARLRFCVTSDHKKEQIAFALDQLKEIALQEGITLPLSHSEVASA